MKVTFRLNQERDGDLIRWLRALPGDPGRSYAIRQALRAMATGRRPEPVQVVEAAPFPVQEAAAEVPGSLQDDLEKKLDLLF